jgi:hypothetical protein
LLMTAFEGIVDATFAAFGTDGVYMQSGRGGVCQRRAWRGAFSALMFSLALMARAGKCFLEVEESARNFGEDDESPA